MTTDGIGRFASYHLAAFQREGCADYVAFATPMKLSEAWRDLVAGAEDMDPRRSGHYDRCRWLVSYLLEDRHVSVDELLGGRLDPAKVETELRAAPPSGRQ